ncbi:MAG: flavin reductase family protein [Deltaproteobacteria bacterium]|jgi:flavin reductase (DIM6/NTAB) family NADH-FMN oxidoreductase RutF|nr:flavin reductase family protein [Deltaproteobacteria bacterium]
MKVSLGPKTIAFPLPAYLVGSYDVDGRPNVMTAAWGGILSSEPPCLGVSVRPGRWTHAGIVKNKAFTVGFPRSGMARETDFVGLYSGKGRDKFKEASLTAARSQLVDAPYVDECPVVAECALEKTLELGSHTLFVGRILDVKANDGVLSDGQLDMGKVDPLVFSPEGEYFQIGSFVARAFSVGKYPK